MNMKTILLSLLTTAVLFSAAGTVNAQYRATGADGITASPKARELMSASKAAASSATATMACPTCKDSVTTRTDWTARGANKPTVTIVKHLCEGCATSTTTTGHGKAAKTSVEHSCTSGANSSCCSSRS
jgi:hypothetical protein